MTGRLAELSSSAASTIASMRGPGLYGSGEDIEPHDINGSCTGVKNTSMGKSSKTGPIYIRVS